MDNDLALTSRKMTGSSTTGRVGNPRELWNGATGAVVIYRSAAGGESLFANLKLSLMATQRVFWSHSVDQHVLDLGRRREYIYLSKLAYTKLPDLVRR